MRWEGIGLNTGERSVRERERVRKRKKKKQINKKLGM
jgi:hypothetical protein